jgi:hypothetical protein
VGGHALDLVAFAGKALHTLSPMSEITAALSRISRVTSMQPAGIFSRFALDKINPSHHLGGIASRLISH